MSIVQNSKGHMVKTVFLPGFPALKETAGSQSLVTSPDVLHVYKCPVHVADLTQA